MRPLEKAAYRRGFLDGGGCGHRSTGQSFRAYLKALLSASDGKMVGFVSSSHKLSEHNSRGIMKIASNYGYVFEYDGSIHTLHFENNSIIKFLVHEDTITDGRGLDCIVYDLTQED